MTNKPSEEKSDKLERPDDGWPLMLKLFILGSFIMGCYNIIQRDDLNILIGLLGVVISAPILGYVGYFLWFIGTLVLEAFFDDTQNILVKLFFVTYAGLCFLALFHLFDFMPL